MPLELIVGWPPLAASRTTHPLIVAVCGLLAALLFGSGLSGVRPRLLCAAAACGAAGEVVCADTITHDSATAAHVDPQFRLAHDVLLKSRVRCTTHQPELSTHKQGQNRPPSSRYVELLADAFSEEELDRCRYQLRSILRHQSRLFRFDCRRP